MDNSDKKTYNTTDQTNYNDWWYSRRGHFHHHKHNKVRALIIIAVGIIALLNSFGLLSPNVWNILWRFWPLYLILLGLNMLFGRSRISNIIFFIISFVIITAVVIFLVTYSYENPNNNFGSMKFWMHNNNNMHYQP